MYEGEETEVQASKWNCFGGAGPDIEEEDPDNGYY